MNPHRARKNCGGDPDDPRSVESELSTHPAGMTNQDMNLDQHYVETKVSYRPTSLRGKGRQYIPKMLGVGERGMYIHLFFLVLSLK